jgi:hypothetical protein
MSLNVRSLTNLYFAAFYKDVHTSAKTKDARVLALEKFFETYHFMDKRHFCLESDVCPMKLHLGQCIFPHREDMCDEWMGMDDSLNVCVLFRDNKPLIVRTALQNRFTEQFDIKVESADNVDRMVQCHRYAGRQVIVRKVCTNDQLNRFMHACYGIRLRYWHFRFLMCMSTDFETALDWLFEDRLPCGFVQCLASKSPSACDVSIWRRIRVQVQREQLEALWQENGFTMFEKLSRIDVPWRTSLAFDFCSLSELAATQQKSQTLFDTQLQILCRRPNSRCAHSALSFCKQDPSEITQLWLLSLLANGFEGPAIRCVFDLLCSMPKILNPICVLDASENPNVLVVNNDGGISWQPQHDYDYEFYNVIWVTEMWKLDLLYALFGEGKSFLLESSRYGSTENIDWDVLRACIDDLHQIDWLIPELSI